MDGNPKQQVAEKLRSSSSVLVTVSNDPSVDQLASAIGLSLMLSKLGKHTTTVFSGKVPNAIKFLEPEKTFDDTVDGLRDFIISLDKEKADKLRYKVEDDVVKIFITPYKAKISEKDLNFSQGDFNVDLVVALGVHKRDELDNAITAHGRILHDATIVTINSGNGKDGNLGAVDWTESAASSLSEMLVSISEALEGGILDQQMSTAFLTGIVAETDRFKNDKTSPKVMTMAAQLMAAGANQQLIAANLQPKDSPKQERQPKDDSESEQKSEDGDNDSFAEENQTMAIEREDKDADEPDAKPVKAPEDLDEDDLLADIEQSVHAKHLNLDENGRTQRLNDEDPAIRELEDELSHDSSSNLIDLESKLKNFDPNAPVEEQPQQAPSHQTLQQPQDRGPISQVKSLTEPEYEDKPALGGTFNATASQAHDEREAERQMEVNREILSHRNMQSANDLQPTEVRAEDMPDSNSLMADLEAARREVEEAMDEAGSGQMHQPSQALNAAPMPLDTDGQMEELNMPQMQQQMPPQQMGGMPQQMPPMMNGNGSMPQQMPPMPMNGGNGGMPQQPPMGNPLFNQGMPQQMPPMNNPMPQQQYPQQQIPPQQQMPPMNGQTPPPMPPSGPPPMPPYN